MILGILIRVVFILLIILLVGLIGQNKAPTTAPTLEYSDSEQYIIETLIANKGKRLTIQEIACSKENRDSLRTKLTQVKAGTLTNKNHLPLFNISMHTTEGEPHYGIS